MAHTPGPWSYDEDSKEVFSGADGYSMGWIALVKGNADSGRSIAEQERLANARLIAAAPELLAVLERCNNRWDDADEEDNPALGQAIRAAIAKATGKESE